MTEEKSIFAPVEELIEEIRNGRMIIVTDDESRENEGDLIVAAAFATPEVINFMATHGKGLVCVPLEESRTKELGLYVTGQRDSMGTAFTQSVDAKEGTGGYGGGIDRSCQQQCFFLLSRAPFPVGEPSGRRSSADGAHGGCRGLCPYGGAVPRRGYL